MGLPDCRWTVLGIGTPVEVQRCMAGASIKGGHAHQGGPLFVGITAIWSIGQAHRGQRTGAGEVAAWCWKDGLPEGPTVTGSRGWRCSLTIAKSWRCLGCSNP